MDYRTADNLKFHRQIAVSFKNGNSFAHENGYDSENIWEAQTCHGNSQGIL